jgi:hypothetical protein
MTQGPANKTGDWLSKQELPLDSIELNRPVGGDGSLKDAGRNL